MKCQFLVTSHSLNNSLNVPLASFEYAKISFFDLENEPLEPVVIVVLNHWYSCQLCSDGYMKFVKLDYWIIVLSFAEVVAIGKINEAVDRNVAKETMVCLKMPSANLRDIDDRQMHHYQQLLALVKAEKAEVMTFYLILLTCYRAVHCL